MPTPDPQSLLRLFQLVSPTLPVGAYSYSEGIETLVQQRVITTSEAVIQWLEQELRWGIIRVDAVAVKATHQAFSESNSAVIAQTNYWLSALRDTEESRQQSWTMGRALNRMAMRLEPELQPWLTLIDTPCNFAISFALLAAHWRIDQPTTVLGYLQSWATNLIAAAVKLVPLGQTVGQQILLALSPNLETTALHCLEATLEDLDISGWGASLASMQHETLYSRLFRS